MTILSLNQVTVPNFENLVKGHFELSYATTMLKQTNLAARFAKSGQRSSFQCTPK